MNMGNMMAQLEAELLAKTRAINSAHMLRVMGYK
jgi:hypothetical protein